MQPSSTIWTDLSGTKPMLNAETMYSMLVANARLTNEFHHLPGC